MISMGSLSIKDGSGLQLGYRNIGVVGDVDPKPMCEGTVAGERKITGAGTL